MSGLFSKFSVPVLAFSGAFVAAIVGYFLANSVKRLPAPKREHGDIAKDVARDVSRKELPVLKTDNTYARAGHRRESIVGESVNEEELRTQDKKVFYQKTEEARAKIHETTKRTLLFRNLDRRQREDIYDAMFEKKVSAGEEIIRQGDEGDFFYIVDSGHFEFYVNGNKVGDATTGKAFGELALLYLQPRAATVKATVDSTVWAVDRSTFRRIVLGSNVRKRRQYQTFLREVPILKSLTEEEVIKAADALEPVTFSAGEIIISEGELGDTFYIIEEGTVSIRQREQEVAKKSKGEYFGEIALLTDGQRVASVVAESQVECLVLDKNAFVRLLGPCVEILKRNMENYKKFEKHVAGN